jgi:hypothetical protein
MRLARMAGNSARTKCNPCRTAIPRSMQAASRAQSIELVAVECALEIVSEHGVEPSPFRNRP